MASYLYALIFDPPLGVSRCCHMAWPRRAAVLMGKKRAGNMCPAQAKGSLTSLKDLPNSDP